MKRGSPKSRGRTRWRPIIMAAIAVSCMAIHCEFASSQETEKIEFSERNWTDSSGQHSVRGILFSCENGIVTLKKADGKFVEIDRKQLSASDQRYVANHLRRARAAERDAILKAKQGSTAAKKSNVDSGAATDAHRDTEKRTEVIKGLPQPKKMFGVNWYKTAQEASQVANANDDKPIVWFRVLGDLAGHM